MKISYLYPVILLAFGSLLGCGGKEDRAADLMRAQIPGAVPNLLSLGQGFDTARANYFNTKCVDGSVKDIDAQTGSVEFVRDMTFEETLNRLMGGISAGIPFPTVKIGATADFASKTSATDYRETYTIFIKNTKKSYFISGTQIISPDIKALTESRRIDVCGDEYINEIESTATFTSTLIFEWGSKEDKRGFGGSLSVNIGPTSIVEVTGKLKYATEKIKSNLRIKLEVNQQGGDAAQLSTILDPSLSFCNGHNIMICLNAFSRTIQYAQHFGTQLTGSDRYIPVNYQTEAYRETAPLAPFFTTPLQSVPEEVLVARQNLENTLQKMRRFHERNEYILRFSSSLSQTDIDKLDQNAENIRTNRNILMRGLTFCYDNPYAITSQGSPTISYPCVDKSIAVLKSLVPIDISLFEIKAQISAADIKCDNARKTLLKLKKISKEDYDFYTNLNWGPELATPGDLKSKILGWIACTNVANNLP